MAAVLGLASDKFMRKYVRLVGIRKSLIERANGDCILLDNQKRICRVYQARPRQCRTWPFWASNLSTPQAWEETCRECPGADSGPLVPLREIQASLDVITV